MLVTRPADAAQRTAARLRAAGHEVMLAPLLEPRAVAWVPPDRLPEAVAFTSAAAARLAGPGVTTMLDQPAFAVGNATADAVHAAGFRDVRTAGGTAGRLFAAIADAGIGQVLHLAGADRVAADAPAGLRIDVRTVYAAGLAEAFPEVARAALAGGGIDIVLLYSPRTAQRFATLIDAAGIDRAGLRLAAISPAALAAAGAGWAAGIAAAAPTEAMLLAGAGLICDTVARLD